ncbi:MAG: L-histidine N(alpha)-methyltransferase [Verrucomicrobiales bacterium]|nr:L-histidine N(alpha)-methyltransferase [Verrucomicrobiales bacterium]
MARSVAVHFHPSCFPRALEAALEASLRARRIHPPFLYDTPRRALLWLRVHEAFSPACTDPSCAEIYEAASEAAARAVAGAGEVVVIALGCGSGQKEVRLLRRVLACGREAVRFVPVDISPGLALMAHDAAVTAGLSESACTPVVMDLAAVEDWAAALASWLRPEARRVVTFFGMLPNVTPGTGLGRLAALVRPGDALLVSANLAPGPDYEAGVERMAPLYDNAPTRQWVSAGLLDLGVAQGDGELEFRIAECPEGSGLRRYEFGFVFRRRRVLEVAGRVHRFEAGERIALFFSYRHTPERVGTVLQPHGLLVEQSWANASGDEGVFLSPGVSQ